MININEPLYDQIKNLSAEEYNSLVDKPLSKEKDPKFYKNIRKYKSSLANFLTNSSLLGVTVFWSLFLFLLYTPNMNLLPIPFSFFVWTSFAYFIHKKSHNRIDESTGPFAKWVTFNGHGFHHLFPYHPANIVIPVWISSIFILPYSAAAFLLFSPETAYGFVFGIIFGHLYIEATHLSMHYETPVFTKLTQFFRMKTHHMNHHWVNPHRRFTYLHSFEDKIYGTE
jgi:hypothetical protein